MDEVKLQAIPVVEMYMHGFWYRRDITVTLKIIAEALFPSFNPTICLDHGTVNNNADDFLHNHTLKPSRGRRKGSCDDGDDGSLGGGGFGGGLLLFTIHTDTLSAIRTKQEPSKL